MVLGENSALSALSQTMIVLNMLSTTITTFR